MKFLWVVTLVAACIASLTLLGALVDDSAVRQSALAAFAVALVVSPYVFTRACEGLSAKPLPKIATPVPNAYLVIAQRDAGRTVDAGEPAVILKRDEGGTVNYIVCTKTGRVGQVVPESIPAATFALLTGSPRACRINDASAERLIVRVEHAG